MNKFEKPGAGYFITEGEMSNLTHMPDGKQRITIYKRGVPFSLGELVPLYLPDNSMAMGKIIEKADAEELKSKIVLEIQPD